MQHVFSPNVEAMLAPLPRPQLLLGDALSAASLALLAAALPVSRVALVADARTWGALGTRVAEMLRARYAVEVVVLEGMPLPDAATAQHVRAATREAQALVAVGSGTINDVCKYASHLAGKPYAVFPTAPSMNGYTSANASIILDGLKQSFAAHLPAAVLCDAQTLAAAPARLLRAGLGDSVARPTAQADWLLSHYLKGTPYDARPFALLADYEPALFANAGHLAEHALGLMEVLLLSGFGMLLAGGSYPASQGEHMIAHCYEMLSGDHSAYHGEAIGVTTLEMARMQERLLPQVGLSAEAEQALRAVMLPAERIESILRVAGCPTTPAELGWDAALYAQAVAEAHTTRDRFTFLNLPLPPAGGRELTTPP